MQADDTRLSIGYPFIFEHLGICSALITCLTMYLREFSSIMTQGVQSSRIVNHFVFDLTSSYLLLASKMIICARSSAVEVVGCDTDAQISIIVTV